MNNQVLAFINVLIECGLIASVNEALILARLTVPGYRGLNLKNVVGTAALRAAHKRGIR